jgi:hypothetical protein
MAAPSILTAMRDPEFWQPWFKDERSWRPWRTFLGALFGLPLDAEGLDMFRACTGRASPPVNGCNEAWLVVGRRGGKSRILALIACYLALFKDWKPHLDPGETGTIRILATDRRQARVIFRYCRALLSLPGLVEMVLRDTEESLDLSNGIVIEVATASFRSNRGYTIIAALCDEIAYWRSDETAANPDSEVINSLRPAMATIPGAMLLCASSPYAKRGELWAHYRRYFGQDDAPALVWKADTRTMHPSLPQRVIDEAYERDPAAAAAEYGAEFRSDIKSYISREVVEGAVLSGVFEVPHLSNYTYTAFCDPSGGSSDSFTLAICHKEADDRVCLDLTREVRPPFSPESVVGEFCDVLKAYRVTTVVGDRYGGEWPREQFLKRGVTYEPSEKPKSDLYRELLPLLNSGKAQLLDNPKLVSQLCSLERRTGRGTGRDVVDHPPSGHDDVANAVAGGLVMCSADAGPIRISEEALRLARMPSRWGNRGRYSDGHGGFF